MFVLAGTVVPVKITELPPSVAARVPPVQVVTALEGDAKTRPVGKLSVIVVLSVFAEALVSVILTGVMVFSLSV